MKYIFQLVVVLLVASSCSSTNAQNRVDANQFEQLTSEDSVYVLDVRTPNEYQQGYIGRAININY